MINFCYLGHHDHHSAPLEAIPLLWNNDGWPRSTASTIVISTNLLTMIEVELVITSSSQILLKRLLWKKIFQTFHKILILCCYQAFAQTAASGTDSRLLHVESWNHWTSNPTQYAHTRWREKHSGEWQGQIAVVGAQRETHERRWQKHSQREHRWRWWEAQPERTDGSDKSTAERARERGPRNESPSDQKAK